MRHERAQFAWKWVGRITGDSRNTRAFWCTSLLRVGETITAPRGRPRSNTITRHGATLSLSLSLGAVRPAWFIRIATRYCISAPTAMPAVPRLLRRRRMREVVRPPTRESSTGELRLERRCQDAAIYNSLSRLVSDPGASWSFPLWTNVVGENRDCDSNVPRCFLKFSRWQIRHSDKSFLGLKCVPSHIREHTC